MKRRAARPQDIADLAALESAHGASRHRHRHELIHALTNVRPQSNAPTRSHPDAALSPIDPRRHALAGRTPGRRPRAALARLRLPARERASHAPRRRTVPSRDLDDVAWLAELYPGAAGRLRRLPTSSQPPICGSKPTTVILFFGGSLGWVLEGAGLWVDVMTDFRTHRRSIAIEAGEKNIAAPWDLAAGRGSGPNGEWRKTRRRPSRGLRPCGSATSTRADSLSFPDWRRRLLAGLGRRLGTYSGPIPPCGLETVAIT
jgi:hypothetical protein